MACLQPGNLVPHWHTQRTWKPSSATSCDSDSNTLSTAAGSASSWSLAMSCKVLKLETVGRWATKNVETYLLKTLVFRVSFPKTSPFWGVKASWWFYLGKLAWHWLWKLGIHLPDWIHAISFWQLQDHFTLLHGRSASDHPTYIYLGVSKNKRENLQNGWLIMETPI